MGESDQDIQRVFVTRKFLDKSRNPPEYVDEKLPTESIRIFARWKPGTLFDPEIHTAAAPLNMGSFQFSGSHYDFSPGSYALRITRRSVYVGSTDRRNVEVEWRLRHSRLGTIDTIPISLGTYSRPKREDNWSLEAFGNPMAPLYSLPPGTIWSYFYKGRSSRGSMRVYSSLEGVF